jgi:hypothetical protein
VSEKEGKRHKSVDDDDNIDDEDEKSLINHRICDDVCFFFDYLFFFLPLRKSFFAFASAERAASNCTTFFHSLAL